MSCGPEFHEDYKDWTFEDIQRLMDRGIGNFTDIKEEPKPVNTNISLIGNRAYRREMVGKYFKK